MMKLCYTKGNTEKIEKRRKANERDQKTSGDDR